jgi:hypothetical protein
MKWLNSEAAGLYRKNVASLRHGGLHATDGEDFKKGTEKKEEIKKGRVQGQIIINGNLVRSESCTRQF